MKVILPPPPPLHKLEEYRLTYDLSYRELMLEIQKATGYHRSPDNWRQICKELLTPSTRTRFAIDQFLAVKRGDAPSPIVIAPEAEAPPAVTPDVMRKRMYLSIDDLMVYLGLTRSQSYAFLRRNPDIRRFRAGGGYRIFRVDVDNKADEMAERIQKKAKAS